MITVTTEPPKDKRIIVFPEKSPLLRSRIDPCISSKDLEVLEHCDYGERDWSLAKGELYLSPNMGPKSGTTSMEISGEELQRELRGKKPANAEWLQYYVDNPDKYPEPWRSASGEGGLYVLFFGTPYGKKSEAHWVNRPVYIAYARWDKERGGLEVAHTSVNNFFLHNDFCSQVALCLVD